MPGLLCFVIDGLHTETLASVRTPHLDRLGRRGASCGRLLAPPPALTLPALTTLFTSLPPEEHGVQSANAAAAASLQAVNLLTLLRYRQLRAAAFYQSDRLRPLFRKRQNSRICFSLSLPVIVGHLFLWRPLL